MIKSAGNRISPTEIEDVAVQCSGISEAVALGIPDERLGAAICLLLRRHGDLDRAEAEHMLKEYLRTELPNFMQPKYIRFVDDFPRNPNGKIRSEEHTSELQSLMRSSYAVFCLKKKK